MTSRTWGPDGSGIPISSANLNGIESDITAATNTANAAIPATQKGAASGVASLDASSLVPVAQLPAATTTTAGAVKLAGDLAGTGAAPTVPALGSKVQIGGDLSGTITAPTVAKVNGVAVSATAPTSGQVLTASSGTAAAWATPSGGGAALGFPAVTGYYYALNAGASANSAGQSAGRVDCVPVYFPAAMTFSSITAYVVTGAASSSMVLGYYTQSGSTLNLGASFGTITTTASGAQTITWSGTIPAGVVWLAYLPLTAVPTMRGSKPPHSLVPGPVLYDTLSGATADVYVLHGPTGQASLPSTITGIGLDFEPASDTAPLFIGKV